MNLHRNFRGLLTCALLWMSSAAPTSAYEPTSSSGEVLTTPKPVKTVTVKNRQQLQTAMAEVEPGTHILLAPGKYQGGASFNGVHGTEEAPIVIRAANPQSPPVFEGGDFALMFSAVSYLELRDLTITKSRIHGLNIDDGEDLENPSHHIVLRRLTVEKVGNRGNQNAIKLSGLKDFQIVDCQIRSWGKEGCGIDLVGCHEGWIQNCVLRDATDPTFSYGIQIKGGSRNVIVERCRFENVGGRGINIGGSTDLEYFRPAPEGFEAKDIVVRDCTFIGSTAAISFSTLDGAEVHHNTIYCPASWAFRILQENEDSSFEPAHNGKVHHNIIVFKSEELSELVNIGDGTAPESFEFEQNFWYCLDQPTQTESLITLPTEETGGIYGKNPQFIAPDNGDLTVKANSPAKNYGPRPKKTK